MVQKIDAKDMLLVFPGGKEVEKYVACYDP